MPKKNIAQTVKELAMPVAEKLGLQVWNVEFGKTGADYELEITIDSMDNNGVSIDDCQRFSDAFNPVIDEADPVEEAYTLSVSSPGVERELKEPEHYRKMMGKPVLVKLYKNENGKKSFEGILADIDDENNVTLSTDDGNVSFPLKAIAKCNVTFKWD